MYALLRYDRRPISMVAVLDKTLYFQTNSSARFPLLAFKVASSL